MNTLELFELEAKTRFFYLMSEFNFLPPEIRTYAYSRTLEYRSPQLSVTLNYEIGSLPWVTLARLAPETHNREIREIVNLDLALSDAGLQRPWSDWVPRDVPADVLLRTVHFQADALKRTCATFLRGEFGAVWSRLVTEQRALSEKRKGMN